MMVALVRKGSASLEEVRRMMSWPQMAGSWRYLDVEV